MLLLKDWEYCLLSLELISSSGFNQEQDNCSLDSIGWGQHTGVQGCPFAAVHLPGLGRAHMEGSAETGQSQPRGGEGSKQVEMQEKLNWPNGRRRASIRGRRWEREIAEGSGNLGRRGWWEGLRSRSREGRIRLLF